MTETPQIGDTPAIVAYIRRLADDANHIADLLEQEVAQREGET